AEIAYKDPKEPKKWPVNTAKGRIDTVRASHPKFVTPTWRVHVLREKGLLRALK
ncbi:MAG: aminomethyl-transferring glycine dehydrogenase subunit GcvPB, partial [Thermoprotei archaeon]